MVNEHFLGKATVSFKTTFWHDTQGHHPGEGCGRELTFWNPSRGARNLTCYFLNRLNSEKWIHPDLQMAALRVREAWLLVLRPRGAREAAWPMRTSLMLLFQNGLRATARKLGYSTGGARFSPSIGPQNKENQEKPPFRSAFFTLLTGAGLALPSLSVIASSLPAHAREQLQLRCAPLGLGLLMDSTSRGSVCWEEGSGQPSRGHGYAHPPLPQSLRERRTSPPRTVPASVCSLAWKAWRPLMSRHTSQQDRKGWTATSLRETAHARREEGHVQKDTEELLRVGEGEDARPAPASALRGCSVLPARVPSPTAGTAGSLFQQPHPSS